MKIKDLLYDYNLKLEDFHIGLEYERFDSPKEYYRKVCNIYDFGDIQICLNQYNLPKKRLRIKDKFFIRRLLKLINII